METVEAKEYIKYLNNPIVFGESLSYNKPKFSNEDAIRYISFLNNVSVEHLYSLSENEKQIVNEVKSEKSLSILSLKNEYLLLAKEEYKALYEKDDGLHYILAFKKFEPLNLETIITWGDEKLRESAELTNSVAKLTGKYNLLSPSNVLKECLDIANGNTNILKKMFGKNNIENAKLKVSALKSQLLPLLNECSVFEAKINKNFEELMFVTSVLTIVNKVNEGKSVKEEDRLLFRTLHNRSMTLTDSLTTSQILKPEISSLKENIVSITVSIDDALLNTFPLIKFGRERDGNV